MKRPARLQAARHWLPTFNGQNMVRDYAKWFGVDLGCAVKELQLLGVELDPRYVEALRTTLQNRARRPKGTEPASEAIPEGYGSDWDENFVYIAGFTSGGAPFGLTWAEMEDTNMP
jgi:hypothetical protein